MIMGTVAVQDGSPSPQRGRISGIFKHVLIRHLLRNSSGRDLTIISNFCYLYS